MINPKKLEAMKRIQEEFKDLNANPIVGFGITVGLENDNDIFRWKCTIMGPKDTNYKGGLFYLKIIFPDNYPHKKPEIYFITPIYHLNVKFFTLGAEPVGHICLSTLNDWKSEYNIRKVLSEIFYLFSHNNPKSPYDFTDQRRRNVFLSNRAFFETKVKYFTTKYAHPQVKQKEYKTNWDFSYP